MNLNMWYKAICAWQQGNLIQYDYKPLDFVPYFRQNTRIFCQFLVSTIMKKKDLQLISEENRSNPPKLTRCLRSNAPMLGKKPPLLMLESPNIYIYIYMFFWQSFAHNEPPCLLAKGQRTEFSAFSAPPVYSSRFVG